MKSDKEILAQILVIMQRIGYCMKVLISNGVFLCDLKPDNVVLKLEKMGALYDLFIIDFGAAYVKGLTQ